jgi:hypothetical protein
MLLQGGDISLLFLIFCAAKFKVIFVVPSSLVFSFVHCLNFSFSFFLAYIYYFVYSKQRLYIHNIFAYSLTHGFIYLNHELYIVLKFIYNPVKIVKCMSWSKCNGSRLYHEFFCWSFLADSQINQLVRQSNEDCLLSLNYTFKYGYSTDRFYGKFSTRFLLPQQTKRLQWYIGLMYITPHEREIVNLKNLTSVDYSTF